MPARRSILQLGFAVVTSALIVITIGSAVFCEASLRAPMHPPPASSAGAPAFPGAASRTVRLTASDGTALEAWFIRPQVEQRGRCVVVLHGSLDSKSGSAGFAPMFLAAGYTVLLPDSRGHGNSGGDLVTFGLREKYDALDWARWLRGEGCTRIYGLGESLGASVLIETTAVDPAFKAIVAECPFADLRTIAEYRVREHLHLPDNWISGLAIRSVISGALVYARMRYGLDLTEVSPLAAIPKSKTPILLIHGMNDVDTPPIHSKRLAEASGTAVLWLVPNASHVSASLAAPNEFQSRVLEWFAQH